jgi:hypothetical protein
MFTRIVTAAWVLGMLGFSGQSNGAIATWSFPNGTDTSPFAADTGSQSGATLNVNSGTGTVASRNGASFKLNFSASGTFTLELSGAGLSGFKVDYWADKNGGKPDQVWSWSTDGNTFSTTGVVEPNATIGNNGSYNVDFSSVSALDGASTIYLRETMTGNAAFDDIHVTAIPEATNAALACAGICFAGVSVWVRRRKAL